MGSSLPPIAKLAHRVNLDVEKAVRRFPRYHKYVIGTDLRRAAIEVRRRVHVAWRDRSDQYEHVHALVTAIDDLKQTIAVAKDLEAFGSFGEFEALSRLAVDLGRQGGGWLKSLREGLNARAPEVPEQRAPILSSRTASTEGARG